MRVRVGTSGFSYPEWVGRFYPAELPQDDWLSFYAARLGAVEINNSFYRVPRSHVVEGWRDAVPADFRIILKVTRRVTHFSRLAASAADPMAWMWRAAEVLGERGGPLLFQLPPNLRADVERLRAFLGGLAELAPTARAAFEFRNPSWTEPDVARVLRDHGAALVLTDDLLDEAAPLPVTAPFGYLRLRREAYSREDLDRWAERLRATGWDEAYVFFKHEDDGTGPALAADFAGRFAAPGATIDEVRSDGTA